MSPAQREVIHQQILSRQCHFPGVKTTANETPLRAQRFDFVAFFMSLKLVSYMFDISMASQIARGQIYILSSEFTWTCLSGYLKIYAWSDLIYQEHAHSSIATFLSYLYHRTNQNNSQASLKKMSNTIIRIMWSAAYALESLPPI